MELAFSPEQEQLRNELRRYFAELLTPEVRADLKRKGGKERVLAQIGRDGWLAPGWPEEYGGRGLGPLEQYLVFDEAMVSGVSILSINTMGPALLRYGTETHRREVLPKLLRGEIKICVGYSEPDSGTDLASLSTKAERDGDEYVINGQKMWTSGATTADFVWLAARTDPDVAKHKGISVFLIPLDTPGIKILPIDILSGHDINQVFYEDVRVPVSALIGDENQGWQIITNQLNQERVVLCSSGIVERALHDVRTWAQQTQLADGRRVIDQEWVQLSLARVHARTEFHRLLNWKLACAAARGELNPADASATKVFGAEFYLESHRLLGEVVGQAAYLDEDSPGNVLNGYFEDAYRHLVVNTFAGGTVEVLRDLIAALGLSMPRSPR